MTLRKHNSVEEILADLEESETYASADELSVFEEVFVGINSWPRVAFEISKRGPVPRDGLDVTACLRNVDAATVSRITASGYVRPRNGRVELTQRGAESVQLLYCGDDVLADIYGASDA